MQDARRRHAEKLAEASPSAKVLETSYDSYHEPWGVARLQAVFETIVSKTLASDNPDAFAMRKEILHSEDEILRFQRCHPKMYYVLTDKEKMANARYRDTIKAMLVVRSQVESGAIPEGMADAAATQAIVSSLQSK